MNDRLLGGKDIHSAFFDQRGQIGAGEIREQWQRTQKPRDAFHSPALLSPSPTTVVIQCGCTLALLYIKAAPR